MFLYFHYAIDNLEDMESISLDELHSLLPDGIDDYYEHNFHRLYQSLGHGQYQIFLQGIMITRSDFPQELVAPLLGVSGQEADKILSKISTLLPIRNGFISIFHKSVKDWLFDSDISGKYAIDAGAGHKYLASLCQSQLKNLKEKFGLSSLDDFLNSPVNQFIVQNIIHHVCHGVQAWSFPQVLNIIEDLQFMFFRLLFSHGRTDGLLDDLIEVLEFSSKSQKICQRARDCYHFIKRYAHLLNNDPHLIFQCALNEPSMFSERLGIRQFLADPLRAFPGLKILLQVENKNEQFSSSLITFSCDDSITSCVLSPDFKVLVGSDISGIVYFWDVSSGELINKADLSGEVRFPNSINCCNISPDGSMVVYGSIMHALNFDAEKVPLIKTDVDHGTNMSIFSPSGEHILAFSYHPDGYFKLFEELEISLDMNFFLEIWDIFDSKYHTLQKVKRKESRPMCGCFSADGKKVFCGYRNGCVIQWDTTSRAASAYLLSTDLVLREGLEDISFESIEGTSNRVVSLAVSLNSHFLAVSTKEGLQLWDAAALRFICMFSPDSLKGNFTDCSFSPSSQYLAAGTTNGYLQVFTIKDFTFTCTVSVNPDGSSNPLSQCLFDNNSGIVCIVGNTARIYDLDSLALNTEDQDESCSTIHPNVANTSIILPEKELAITLGGKSLCLWDVSRNRLQSSVLGSVGGYLLRVSADGKLLLTYGDRCYIEVWQVENLTKIRDLIHRKQKNLPIGRDHPDESSPSDICHCAVSVSGIVVGGTGNGDLFVWHGDNMENVKEFDMHESLITFTEFSPSGDRFVSADMDGVIMMWHIHNTSGRDFRVHMIPLKRHSDSIEQVCYSSQGRRIVSCSMDKSVHLYDGLSGDIIAEMTSHNSGVMRVAFSLSECLIASGDEKGEIIIWDGVTGELQQRIKPQIEKIILDLHFIKQEKYVCCRDTHSGFVVVNEVSSGNEISRLCFTTEIYSMSASSFWTEKAYILCCLKDSSIKFVKLLDSDSLNLIG